MTPVPQETSPVALCQSAEADNPRIIRSDGIKKSNQ